MLNLVLTKETTNTTFSIEEEFGSFLFHVKMSCGCAVEITHQLLQISEERCKKMKLCLEDLMWINLWACVSALTVLLLLHAAPYSIPELKEPSGFWTVIDVVTSGVRLMLCHLPSFTHSESFGLLNQFFGEQFYLGDLIDMQIKLWSEKVVYYSFNLEIMLIRKMPYFGRINAIGECLDFKI